MNIKVWGCRGSLPAPGENTIKYGGNTTCLEIRLNDNTLIIIDAGSGIRNLGKKLLAEQNLTEMYLFLTHAHWDHLMGFPFFVPGYLSRYKIHVRGGECAKRTLEQYLRHQMEPPYFPVPFDAMKAEFDFTSGDARGMSIGSAEIIPIPLNHPNGGCGFKIIEEGKTLVFLTDNELDFRHEGGMTKDEYISFSKGADVLIHDAQYTEKEYKATKGWGHTTFSSATELSIKAEVRHLGLWHHDPEHTDDDIDGFVASCQEKIAQANSHVQCFGVREGMEISIT
ncbi:MBL fold metallo-hydrolase [bacterium]|nr:MBL fold metallo-hydrolase [bacterium]